MITLIKTTRERIALQDVCPSTPKLRLHWLLTVVCCQKTSNRDHFENPLRPYSISFSFPTSVQFWFSLSFFFFFFKEPTCMHTRIHALSPLQTTSNPGHTSSSILLVRFPLWFHEIVWMGCYPQKNTTGDRADGVTIYPFDNNCDHIPGTNNDSQRVIWRLMIIGDLKHTLLGVKGTKGVHLFR